MYWSCASPAVSLPGRTQRRVFGWRSGRRWRAAVDDPIWPGPAPWTSWCRPSGARERPPALLPGAPGERHCRDPGAVGPRGQRADGAPGRRGSEPAGAGLHGRCRHTAADSAVGRGLRGADLRSVPRLLEADRRHRERVAQCRERLGSEEGPGQQVASRFVGAGALGAAVAVPVGPRRPRPGRGRGRVGGQSLLAVPGWPASVAVLDWVVAAAGMVVALGTISVLMLELAAESEQGRTRPRCRSPTWSAAWPVSVPAAWCWPPPASGQQVRSRGVSVPPRSPTGAQSVRRWRWSTSAWPRSPPWALWPPAGFAAGRSGFAADHLADPAGMPG